MPFITNRIRPALLLLILVGILDWISGHQISFSLFYLIPLAWAALSGEETKTRTVFFSLGSALVGLIIDITTNPSYTHILFPFINALLRLVIFLTFSLLLISVREKRLLLEKSNRRLTEMNEEKNRFIGITAHDLRTSIGAIRSFSELILEHAHTPSPTDHDQTEQTEFLRYIYQASEDALELMENMLDVAKIESGTLTLNPQSVNYPQLVKKCIDLHILSAKQKNITFTYAGPENFLQTIDPYYIEEALNNLLTNAIKFSHPDSSVRVNVIKTGLRIRTEVSDHGVGIPADETSQLFQFFQKTSARPTAGESSTGLGLAIVKKIITLHNGTVGVESVQGKGSTFFFELPLD